MVIDQAYEVPLISQNQTLTITLNGTTYQLTVTWNEPAQTWMLDISDNSGNLIVGGIAMTTGIDLLGQFGYLGIGGALLVYSDGQDFLASPTFDNLGGSSHLYFVPNL